MEILKCQDRNHSTHQKLIWVFWLFWWFWFMQGICPKPLTENWMVISAVSHPLLRSCGCGDVPGLRRSSCGMWMTRMTPMTRMTRMKNGWKMSLKRVVMDETWHCFTFGSYSAGILSRNVADEVAGSRTMGWVKSRRWAATGGQDQRFSKFSLFGRF